MNASYRRLRTRSASSVRIVCHRCSAECPRCPFTASQSTLANLLVHFTAITLAASGPRPMMLNGIGGPTMKKLFAVMFLLGLALEAYPAQAPYTLNLAIVIYKRAEPLDWA